MICVPPFVTLMCSNLRVLRAHWSMFDRWVDQNEICICSLIDSVVDRCFYIQHEVLHPHLRNCIGHFMRNTLLRSWIQKDLDLIGLLSKRPMQTLMMKIGCYNLSFDAYIVRIRFPLCSLHCLDSDWNSFLPWNPSTHWFGMRPALASGNFSRVLYGAQYIVQHLLINDSF